MCFKKTSGVKIFLYFNLLTFFLVFFAINWNADSGKKTHHVNSVSEIRLAIEKCRQDEGGIIKIAAGHYYLDLALVIDINNVIIVGSGIDTVFTLNSKANSPIFFFGSFKDKPKDSYSNLHISDLVIDGNRDGQSSEIWPADDGAWLTNNGITFRNVTDASASRVIAMNCRSGGIVFAESCERIHLNSVKCCGNYFDGIAWDVAATDCTINNSTCNSNGAAGISLDCGPEECTFNYVTCTNNLASGLFVRDCRNCKFNKCHFDSNKEDGVFIADSEDEKHGSSGHVFEDCSFQNNHWNGLALRGDLSVNVALVRPLLKNNGREGTSNSFPKIAKLNIVENLN